MSKLSFEQETITANKSNICKCGRRIFRGEDIAKGMCRVCNPFSLKNTIFGGRALSERNYQSLNPVDRSSPWDNTGYFRN